LFQEIDKGRHIAMDLTALKQLVIEHSYQNELTPQEIGANRRRILDSARQVLPETMAQLWLLETGDHGPHLRLSYVSLQDESQSLDAFKEHSVPIQLTKAAEEFDGKSLATLKARAATLAQIVIPNAQIVHLAPLERRIVGGATETRDFASHSGALGVLALGGPANIKPSDIQLIALSLIRNRLSAILEQSRLRRINSFHQDVRSCFEGVRGFDDSANKVGALLKTRIGFELVKGYQVLDMHTLRPLGNFSDGNIKLAASMAKIISSGQPRRLVGAGLQALKLWIPNAENALVLPVSMPALDLGHDREFALPADIEIRAATKKATHVLIGINKTSPHYLGRWFSETDVAQATIAGHALAEHSVANKFRSTLSDVTKYFSRQVETIEIDAGAFESVVESNATNVAFVGVFEGVGDSDVEARLNGGKVAASALNALARATISELGKVDSTKEWRIKYCCAPAEAGGVQHLFSIPTRHARYVVVFSSSDPIVDRADFDFMKHVSQEFQLALRHEEWVREHGSVMGQIRHATIGSLSGCIRYVSALYKASERAKRTDAAWLKFRSDPALEGLKQRVYPLALYLESRLVLEYETSRKNIYWELKTNIDHSYEVTGDKSLLYIVIYNLLENALKFCSPNTKIKVDLRALDNRWRMTVENEGSYIKDEDRSKIFELFYRGKQIDTLNRRAGTGIGLPVAKMILKAHSDSCEINVSCYRGERPSESRTLFSFELPVRLANGE
jgi:hypothetical protein